MAERKVYVLERRGLRSWVWRIQSVDVAAPRKRKPWRGNDGASYRIVRYVPEVKNG